MNTFDTMDKLLKDELSATETYQQALDELRKEVGISETVELMPLFEAHKAAVSSLQMLIREQGGTPSEGSGAWGTWAKIVIGGANILGKDAVLKALYEGEKNGAEDYQKALESPDIPLNLRSLIDSTLLPGQESNIRILDKLMDTVDA